MKTRIEVKNHKEAVAIKRALDDKETRALVLVIGYILAVEGNRGRQRVLEYVADFLEEKRMNSEVLEICVPGIPTL
jgi:DUF1009 family protein